MLKSCSSLQRQSANGAYGGRAHRRAECLAAGGGSVVEKNETKYAINLNSHQDDYFLPCSANIKISCNGKRRTQNKQREQQRQQQLRKMAVKVAHILHASGTQNAYESKSSWNYHINQATTTALQQLATGNKQRQQQRQKKNNEPGCQSTGAAVKEKELGQRAGPTYKRTALKLLQSRNENLL